MSAYQLLYEKGHIFAVLEKEKYLLDTGSPNSFGEGPFELAGPKRDVSPEMLGLNPKTLSEFLGVETKGLIGTDILNSFDSIWDIKEGNLVCGENLSLDGEKHPFEFYTGIPVVAVDVFGEERKFFFDTGAQISYFQSPVLEHCEYIGEVNDFYPGIGRFNTRTYRLPVKLGSEDIEIVAGKLEEKSLTAMALTALLKMSGITGIIGNEIIRERKLGYFPGRKLLALS